ncbi:CDP-glycerol glycerophosphotransferase family protein [Paenibacillus medicaginis]|uniref:CDP-glycerol glycerophosphotransferase family protein n=1 Tax=Paenibacillus medicaginis TaxID=1470560 RepID=A0ABV5BXK2_9BACL
MNPKIKITMFHLSASGSNNYYLYHAASDELKSKYDIELLTREQTQYNRYIDQGDVYITTHGEYSSNYDKINIDLWHGFPLKGMAKMDRQDTTPDQHIHEHWSKTDMIMSYSTLYNTAMNACNGGIIDQYRITGLPRNDALFSQDSKEKLKRLFPDLNGDKVIFFMPTFRKSVITPDKIEGAKNFGNIFGLSDFHKTNLVQYLKKNRISLVLKLHPFEEDYFTKELEELSREGIFTLSDSQLSEAKLDLYDVLGAADMLLTDYSSVYIDFLLLNRPVMFVPTDLEDYKQNRGLLFEPYDFWTPGPKLYSQTELENAISRFLTEPEWYSSERNTILNLCHHYRDNQASKRIWELIDSYIEEHKDLIYKRRETYQQHKQIQQQIKHVIQGMIEQGNLQQANDAIQRYLETNQADPDIFAMNGMLHLLTDNPQEAIQSFLKGHQHFPWDEDLLYNLGYVYETTGDLAAAKASYNKAMQQSTKPEVTALLTERLAAISSEG